MGLQSQEMNYLSIADKSIHIERDYKKALSHLNKFLDDNPTNTEDIEKANYLMGEAYLRSFNTELSLEHLQFLTTSKNKTKYYHDALLLEGYSFANCSEYKKALTCYLKIVEDKDVKEDIYIKAQIGKIDVLTTTGSVSDLNEAETILKKMLEKRSKEILEMGVMSTCFFYLACIEEERKNTQKAVGYLDSAINMAQRNEKQILLFKKLLDVNSSDKDEVVEELYNSLEFIASRPEVEAIDNPIGFNIMYACQILAEFILNYHQYDVRKYLRLFLYDSKENAIIYIYKILTESNDERAKDFFNYILGLIYDEEWHFDNDQFALIARKQLLTFNKSDLSVDYIGKIESNFINNIPEEGGDLLIDLTHYYLFKREIKECESLYTLFERKRRDIKGISEDKKLLMDYYYALTLFIKKDIVKFRTFGATLLSNIYIYKAHYQPLNGGKLTLKDINIIINDLQKLESQSFNELQNLGIKKVFSESIRRNSILKVQYISDKRIVTEKYKKIEKDLSIGLCEVIEVISK
jgi:tetratricopeptide (TPR) repeat protein